ncbi:ion transporter [Acuticoccus kandeliae]|uniref:ion transporter n=1 Tax=Acuticoccus kandeliae TaxID=2073160 RepID=UPI000D3E6265|nr:ion transporter [Acuticoccus kandeliae]
MRETIRHVLETRWWDQAITALIVVNAVTLGLETSETMMAQAGPILLVIDKAILAIFVVEIALRLYVHRLRFFRDPWSLFDFAIVAIALIPASGPFQVLRALRILRVLRLLSMVPSLRRVVNGLVTALPGMGSIIVLLCIVFYVASVIATELFGATHPEWFGTIGLSAYTLFQVMTLESWSMGIARPVMDAMPYAWIFFVPFILLTSFVVLNLFIGVVVSAMQETVEAEAEEDREAIHEESTEIARSIRELRGEISELKRALERNVLAERSGG